MSVQLKPETERLVDEEIKRGHFQSVDELIVQGVRAWREKHQVEQIEETPATSPGPEGKKSLSQLFAESPFKGLGMSFERWDEFRAIPGYPAPGRFVKGFLLDTNIPSELTYPQPALQVKQWLEKVNNQQLFISVISLAEICKGIAKLSESKKNSATRVAGFDVAPVICRPHLAGYRSHCRAYGTLGRGRRS